MKDFEMRYVGSHVEVYTGSGVFLFSADTVREAMEERDKIVHEARKQAEIAAQKQLEAVKQQIQIEKDEAIRDIRRQVAVLSVDIAEKVLRKNLQDKESQMGMIDRMLDEVLTPNKN